MLNQTHNPELVSWVKSANQENTDFPIQNLPFAIFRRTGSDEAFRGGVAIGDEIIDLAAAKNTALFEGQAQAALEACDAPELNQFMDMGKSAWSALRLALSVALTEGSDAQDKLSDCLVSQ